MNGKVILQTIDASFAFLQFRDCHTHRAFDLHLTLRYIADTALAEGVMTRQQLSILSVVLIRTREGVQVKTDRAGDQLFRRGSQSAAALSFAAAAVFIASALHQLVQQTGENCERKTYVFAKTL